jgi:hypothetical protein
MPTLNINGNIRTNTAAGWAADTTVYSAKTILVTTDATYTGTDQRKFKIADGTQTWAQLDYFPADIIYLSGTTKTVQQSDVIAQWIGATNRFSLTNDNNAYAKAWIFMTQSSASYGFNDAWLEAATGYLYLKASNVNMFGEPDGDRILSLDTNKNIKGLDTATYPDLTELSYVKGVTSNIQTQLDSKQAAGSYLTSANITQVITNGVTDKAPSEDAVFDALALKQPLDADLTSIAALSPSNDDIIQRKSGAWTNRTLAQVVTDLNSTAGLTGLTRRLTYDFTQASHTGDTNNTLKKSFLIPANTIQVGDTFNFQVLSTKTTTAAGTVNVYVNDTNDLTTPTRLVTYQQTAANTYGKAQRQFFIRSSTETIGHNNNNSSASEIVLSNNSMANINIDWSIDQYFIISIQLNNSADTMSIEGYYINIMR